MWERKHVMDFTVLEVGMDLIDDPISVDEYMTIREYFCATIDDDVFTEATKVVPKLEKSDRKKKMKEFIKQNKKKILATSALIAALSAIIIGLKIKQKSDAKHKAEYEKKIAECEKSIKDTKEILDLWKSELKSMEKGLVKDMVKPHHYANQAELDNAYYKQRGIDITSNGRHEAWMALDRYGNKVKNVTRCEESIKSKEKELRQLVNKYQKYAKK